MYLNQKVAEETLGELTLVNLPLKNADCGMRKSKR